MPTDPRITFTLDADATSAVDALRAMTAQVDDAATAAGTVTVELSEATGQVMYAGVARIRIHRATVRYWPPEPDQGDTGWYAQGPALEAVDVNPDGSDGDPLVYTPPSFACPQWLRDAIDAYRPQQ